MAFSRKGALQGLGPNYKIGCQICVGLCTISRRTCQTSELSFFLGQELLGIPRCRALNSSALKNLSSVPKGPVITGIHHGFRV